MSWGKRKERKKDDNTFHASVSHVCRAACVFYAPPFFVCTKRRQYVLLLLLRSLSLSLVCVNE